MDHSLGLYDSPESWEKYHRLIADHPANGGKPVLPPPSGEPLTVQRLCLAYSDFAETYYVNDGRQTAEVNCLHNALKRLIKLYGTTFAAEVSPKALKLVRDEFNRLPFDKVEAMPDGGLKIGSSNAAVSCEARGSVACLAPDAPRSG